MADSSVLSHSPSQVFSDLAGPTPPLPWVDVPTEPLPDNWDERNDDEDCIMTDYSLPTIQYTTLDISNSKGLKAAFPTTLGNKLVAGGHVGPLKPELLLSKYPLI